MAYIPGAGMKKPLNMLEGPVYPDIKKTLPRFRWSGKHWKVDTSVLRDTEQMTQFYEPAVLVQPRDYNQTRYGQSSHRDVVNAEFRPPLLDPIEDFFPLSRLPRKLVVPRINPSSAGHDGTSGYSARNQRINNVESHITDRVQAGEWRPTFYAPLDMPIDNSVLPDLEMVLPAVSASAGFVFPTIDAPTAQINLDYEMFTPLIDTGFQPLLQIDAPTGKENMELHHTIPQVSASAGITTQLNFDAPDPRQNLELETKLDAPHTVLNPAPTGDQSTMIPLQEAETFIQDGNPAYSYVVPANYNYQSRNELTHQPHFREKLQVRGRILNQGHIPQAGVMNPGKMLHDRIQPKKAKYSI